MFAFLKRTPTITFPTRDFLSQASSMTEFTPDYIELQQRERHLLFEYGRFMQAGPEGDKLDCRLYTAYTNPNTQGFSLWKHKLGKHSYPLAIPQGYSNAPAVAIKGELHGIRPHQFLELDKSFMNGVLYQRQRVNLIIPYRCDIFPHDRTSIEETLGVQWDKIPIIRSDVKFVKLSAWMYVGMSDLWCDLLDGGMYFSPVRRFKPKRMRDQYYYFSQLEYET